MLEIINCEQNSAEWLKARAGIPTASQFHAILAKGKAGTKDGKTRRTYMLKLADEIYSGEPMENISNKHTERGHAMEAEARDLYAFKTGAQLERVGFLKNGRKGASPDSLIGSAGGAEIKTKLPHLLYDDLLAGEIPSEHFAQIQGTLWVSERQWWDLVIYWPKRPLFIKRVFRDELYIQKLATAVDAFNAELDETVAKIRAYDTAAAA
jgi:hypothetical protein